jgi:hypothetical protein
MILNNFFKEGRLTMAEINDLRKSIHYNRSAGINHFVGQEYSGLKGEIPC